MRPLLKTTEDDLASSDPVSVIRDLASNDQENASTEVVRRHYRNTLTPTPKPIVLDPTKSEPNQSVTQDNISEAERTSLKQAQLAPQVPEQRSAHVGSYHALQEWEGHVTAIADASFVAELVDVTRAARLPEEQAEIPLAELSYLQKENLRLGSVFRWAIGYQTLPSGEKQRVSRLVFRQLPQWTKAELDAAERRANARYRDLRWE